MRARMQAGHDLYFVIQEQHRGEQAKQAFISPDVIEGMIHTCQFKMSKIKVELSSKLAATEILLCLGSEGAFPISRFPRSLLQDEDLSHSKFKGPIFVEMRVVNDDLSSFTGTRQHLVINSGRWAGRTPSQQLRRKNWAPPDLTQSHTPADTISRYSAHNFVIGNASPNRLKRIAHRLLNGPSPAPASEESFGHVTLKDSAENIRLKFEQAELPDNQVGPIFELSGSSPTLEFDNVPVYNSSKLPTFAEEKARILDSEGSHGIHPAERDTVYSSSPPNSFHESDTVTEVDGAESFHWGHGKQREDEGGFF